VNRCGTYDSKPSSMHITGSQHPAFSDALCSVAHKYARCHSIKYASRCYKVALSCKATGSTATVQTHKHAHTRRNTCFCSTHVIHARGCMEPAPTTANATAGPPSSESLRQRCAPPNLLTALHCCACLNQASHFADYHTITDPTEYREEPQA
jgi:hypothetical protein